MFTGIVEEVARIERLEERGEKVELCIHLSPQVAADVKIGASVAIDGCCLTATRTGSGELCFEAVPETLRTTSLGDRAQGDAVNVERALAAGGRLDGHIVTGHVDATGTIRERAEHGDDVLLRIDAPVEVVRYLVPKGSITVDGVSLTVVSPDESGFSVALIPHTIAATTLGERRAGERVNLEADVLGKYVYRYVQQGGAAGGNPAADNEKTQVR